MNIEMLDGSAPSARRLMALLKELDKSYLPQLSSIHGLNIYRDKLITNGEIYVLKKGDVEIGFVAIYLNDYKTKCAFISSIGIKRKYRGSGMGKMLIDYVTVVARDRGMRKIRLEVDIQNEAARQLYMKCDFKRKPRLRSNKTHSSMLLEKELKPHILAM